jgi:hypothetical protein
VPAVLQVPDPRGFTIHKRWCFIPLGGAARLSEKQGRVCSRRGVLKVAANGRCLQTGRRSSAVFLPRGPV